MGFLTIRQVIPFTQNIFIDVKTTAYKQGWQDIFFVPTLFARECIPYEFPRKEYGNLAKSNISACCRQVKV